ncbi:islet amyloid polypeptide [Trichomycterus rosablanca]|uniref:islet amyloid polypeptide n=1 Tax=Trichomycterus rosablanca TaxID=2290929 RepID=UPI002F356099
MHHLKVPVLLLLVLVLLHCVTAAPNNRFSISSSKLVNGALDEKEWMMPGLLMNPYLRFAGLRSQRALSTVNSQQHHIEKRRCNTATCMTQRLADFLVRSSNTVGTVYIPTDIGGNTFGKRDVFQSIDSLPL